MTWLFAVIALLLIAALGLVLAGKLPAVPQPTSGEYATGLPEHPTLSDIDGLRLPVVLRGYRMEEVDAALTTLRHRIAELEATASTLPVTGATVPTLPASGTTEAQDPATDG